MKCLEALAWVGGNLGHCIPVQLLQAVPQAILHVSPSTEAPHCDKMLLTLLFGGCPKVQLIRPPRNCSGFKTESHIGRLKASRVPFVLGCKIYVCLLHQPRHVHQEDVQTQATMARQRVDMEHNHNQDTLRPLK